MTEGLYTTNELAELAGVDPSRVRQLILDGTIKAEKMGRDWVISKEVADEWLKNRQREQA